MKNTAKLKKWEIKKYARNIKNITDDHCLRKRAHNSSKRNSHVFCLKKKQKKNHIIEHD